MPLTPQEIQTHEFHVRFRGFDVEEVDSFLEKVAAELLALTELNKNLTEQVESLSQEMADYQSKGKAFQHAIFSAQQIAEDLMEKSRTEAEKLLMDAHSEADEIRESANAEVAALEREVDRLESLRSEAKSELQRMLQGYLGMLDAPPSSPSFIETAAARQEPPAPRKPEAEDDLSDLYQKIDLPDDHLDTMVGEETRDLDETDQGPQVRMADDEPYSAIPNLDDMVVFNLEDPLDANEPSVNFADLVPKDDK